MFKGVFAMKSLFTGAIIAFLLFCTLEIGPIQAQTLDPFANLAIFDADEKRLGPTWNLPPIAFLKVNEFIYIVEVKKTSLRSTQPNLFFEFPDCQGLPGWPSIDVQPDDIYQRVYLGGQNITESGNVVYAANTTEPAREIPRMSRLVHGECENQSSSPAFVVGVQQIIDLDALFVPPFSVKPDTSSSLEQLQTQLDTLQEQLNNHYHKLKLGRRFRLPTGPAIIP